MKKHLSTNCAKAASTALCLLLAAAGCSEKPSRMPSDSPGVMRIVRATTIYDPHNIELVANGSFERWPNGAPRPAGPYFGPSLTPAYSTIRREPIRDGDSGDANALRQTWTAAETHAGPMNLFGVVADGLAPHTRYEFRFEASTLNAAGAMVVVYGIYGQRFSPLAVPLVEIGAAKELTAYAGRFNSANFSKVKIATLSPDAPPSAFPNDVVWNAFSLRRAE